MEREPVILNALLLFTFNRLMVCSVALAGGGVSEPGGDPAETMPEESGRAGDAAGPVSRVGLCIIGEHNRKVAAGPSLTVHEIPDDVDDCAQMPAIVEPVGVGEELCSDGLCSQRSGSPVFACRRAPGGRLCARSRALG